jgi:hypothetical protein
MCTAEYLVLAVTLLEFYNVIQQINYYKRKYKLWYL